jgi:hypothetical protein
MFRLSLSQLSLPAIGDSDKRAVASQKILQTLSETHLAYASKVRGIFCSSSEISLGKAAEESQPQRTYDGT